MYDPGHNGLVWTSTGDLLKDSNQKLMEVNGFDNFTRRLMFLLRTEPGDYKYAPDVGIGLERYLGRVNTRVLRDELQAKILRQLISHDIVYPYIPDVTVTSINRKSLRITLSLSSETFTHQSALALDIRNGKLIPIGLDQTLTEHDDTPEVTPGSPAEVITNKYLSRK